MLHMSRDPLDLTVVWSRADHVEKSQQNSKSQRYTIIIPLVGKPKDCEIPHLCIIFRQDAPSNKGISILEGN
jgi:hypothetical protein